MLKIAKRRLATHGCDEQLDLLRTPSSLALLREVHLSVVDLFRAWSLRIEILIEIKERTGPNLATGD